MYNFMQIYGSCAAVHYLGPDRIRGPVDNVIAKGRGLISALLDGTYIEHIKNGTPEIKSRNPIFLGDSPVYYCYDIVNIVHEDPRTDKYQEVLQKRLANFKDFLDQVRSNDNYYFVYSLNIFDLNKDTHKLNGNILLKNIEYLKEKKLLDKTIFVGCTPGKTGRTWWDFWSNDLIPLITKYNLKYVEVTEMCYGITPDKDKVLAAKFQELVSATIKNGTNKKYLQPRDKKGNYIIVKNKPKKPQGYLNTPGFFGL